MGDVGTFSEADAPWYVLKCMGGTEEKLVNRIENKADRSRYEHCWIPTRTERRKYRGKIVDVRMKLFTGYVFISTKDIDGLFLDFRSKLDFLKVLKNDDTFCPLGESDVEVIKHLTGWKPDKPSNNVEMSVGVIIDGVLKVLDGPLSGMEEYVVKIDRTKKKAWLEMKLFCETKRFVAGLEIIQKR